MFFETFFTAELSNTNSSKLKENPILVIYALKTERTELRNCLASSEP